MLRHKLWIYAIKPQIEVFFHKSIAYALTLILIFHRKLCASILHSFRVKSKPSFLPDLSTVQWCNAVYYSCVSDCLSDTVYWSGRAVSSSVGDNVGCSTVFGIQIAFGKKQTLDRLMRKLWRLDKDLYLGPLGKLHF